MSDVRSTTLNALSGFVLLYRDQMCDASHPVCPCLSAFSSLSLGIEQTHQSRQEKERLQAQQV
jgi:hypothetical protein